MCTPNQNNMTTDLKSHSIEKFVKLVINIQF